MKNLTKTGSFSNSLIKEVKTHAGLPFVAQLVKNLPAMGRAGFNPWVGKTPWRRAWQPTPVFLLENPMDRGAWRAAVRRVAKSWTD